MTTLKWNGSIIAVLFLAATACSTAAKKAPDATAPKAVAATPAKVSAPTAPAHPQEILCEHGGDKRSLTFTKTEKGCELHYSKFGKSSILASSDKGVSHCEDVQAKVKKKLEASSFSCK